MATEDFTIAQACKKVLGEICITLPKEYINYNGKGWINYFHIDRENDFYIRSKEYLLEMGLLAKCNSFITARCSGASGVMLMAENFEHVYAFNLGLYNYIDMADFGND